jgi:preprotein translocase subunit SecE
MAMQSSSAIRADGQEMADKIKLAVAVLLIMGGIAGFYYLSESAMVLRVAAILAGFAAGIALGWFTEPGRQLLVFVRESVVEVKKVVWPTRKESLQTAGVVFAFVLVMAVFLWISDKSLEFVLYDLILGWKQS